MLGNSNNQSKKKKVKLWKTHTRANTLESNSRKAHCRVFIHCKTTVQVVQCDMMSTPHDHFV